jgi:hypothetical protein
MKHGKLQHGVRTQRRKVQSTAWLSFTSGPFCPGPFGLHLPKLISHRFPSIHAKLLHLSCGFQHFNISQTKMHAPIFRNQHWGKWFPSGSTPMSGVTGPWEISMLSMASVTMDHCSLTSVFVSSLGW